MTDKELLLAISDLFDKKFEEKFIPIKQELKEIRQDIAEMKQDIVEIKQDIKELNRRLTLVELTLENEVKPNIMLVAEGHHILNRKLDEALQVDNEKEMLMIRVNILESEVRKLKEQINQIA